MTRHHRDFDLNRPSEFRFADQGPDGLTNGSRTVSIVDLQNGQRIRDIAVGLRPNDMALAPDGRLFVACAGDNSVHVIQTKAVETPEPGASPTRRPSERCCVTETVTS